MATRWPACSSATATCMAVVDLPEPPFSLPRTMTCAENGLPTSACINMTRRDPCVTHDFSGLQRVRSRYSIGLPKLIINRASASPKRNGCARAATMKMNSQKIEASPARHTHIAEACAARSPNCARGARTIALVPTMGALHAGHFSLVQIAQAPRRPGHRLDLRQPDAVCAERGPKHLSAHLVRRSRRAQRALKADLVWAPSVETMYPEGFATRIVPEGPATAGLEDAFRPHFFAGVATVVAKLLIQCEPDIAMFGEKDLPAAQSGHPAGARSWAQRPASSARRSCARRTASRCPRATAISRRTSARRRRRSTACSRDCAERIAAGGPIDAVLDDGPCSDYALRLCARLPRSAQRRDAGAARRAAAGRADPASGRGADRQDAADR